MFWNTQISNKVLGRCVPNSSTIRGLAKRFKETGSVKNRNVNRRRHVLTEETLNEFGERLKHNPQKSLKRFSQETGVCVPSIQRAAKLLKLKPYKIPVVHALHQPDPNKRQRFCNWMLEKRTGCKKNIFSDEAWFYLHGKVCSQNYRYYSDWKTERVFASSGSMKPR